MMHEVRDGISGGEVFAHARVIGIAGGIRSESGGCEDDGWTTGHDSKKMVWCEAGSRGDGMASCIGM